ncbi:hypothetical protein L1987_22421 [Smallanthus sonchifolius]|uniref:Uncharacterized protein n=1 Tax=Smallanthus sonchifolius TaxID=185202 RepID=A0ACB9IE39_9ASTR|nr:hypothetical protein L1987_22421 [Smallanthus sonchifolius]
MIHSEHSHQLVESEQCFPLRLYCENFLVASSPPKHFDMLVCGSFLIGDPYGDGSCLLMTADHFPLLNDYWLVPVAHFLVSADH